MKLNGLRIVAVLLVICLTATSISWSATPLTSPTLPKSQPLFTFQAVSAPAEFERRDLSPHSRATVSRLLLPGNPLPNPEEDAPTGAAKVWIAALTHHWSTSLDEKTLTSHLRAGAFYLAGGAVNSKLISANELLKLIDYVPSRSLPKQDQLTAGDRREIGAGLQLAWDSLEYTSKYGHLGSVLGGFFLSPLNGGEGEKRYVQNELKYLNLLDGLDRHDRLLAYGRRIAIQVGHLRQGGPHSMLSNGLMSDNWLLTQYGRAFIPLVLASEDLTKVVPEPQRTFRGRRPTYNYADWMLWTLAILMDPTIHDLGVKQSHKFINPDPLTRQKETERYIIEMITNLPPVNPQGRTTTGTLSAKKIAKFIALAVSVPEERWIQKGMQIPAFYLTLENPQLPFVPYIDRALSDAVWPDYWDRTDIASGRGIYGPYPRPDLIQKEALTQWPGIQQVLPTLREEIAAQGAKFARHPDTIPTWTVEAPLRSVAGERIWRIVADHSGYVFAGLRMADQQWSRALSRHIRMLPTRDGRWEAYLVNARLNGFSFDFDDRQFNPESGPAQIYLIHRYEESDGTLIERADELIEMYHDLRNEFEGLETGFNFLMKTVSASDPELALHTDDQLAMVTAIRSKLQTWSSRYDRYEEHPRDLSRAGGLAHLGGDAKSLRRQSLVTLKSTRVWLQENRVRFESLPTSAATDQVDAMLDRLTYSIDTFSGDYKMKSFDLNHWLLTSAERRPEQVSASTKPLFIEADQNRINRIIRNVFENAIAKNNRFRDTSTGQTAGATTRWDIRQEGNSAVLVISDNGKGMDSEQLAKAREVLEGAAEGFTTKSAQQEMRGGHGLRIIRKRVKETGGEVSMTSRLQVPGIPADQREFVTEIRLTWPLIESQERAVGANWIWLRNSINHARETRGLSALTMKKYSLRYAWWLENTVSYLFGILSTLAGAALRVLPFESHVLLPLIHAVAWSFFLILHFPSVRKNADETGHMHPVAAAFMLSGVMLATALMSHIAIGTSLIIWFVGVQLHFVVNVGAIFARGWESQETQAIKNIFAGRQSAAGRMQMSLDIAKNESLYRKISAMDTEVAKANYSPEGSEAVAVNEFLHLEKLLARLVEQPHNATTRLYIEKSLAALGIESKGVHFQFTYYHLNHDLNANLEHLLANDPELKTWLSPLLDPVVLPARRYVERPSKEKLSAAIAALALSTGVLIPIIYYFVTHPHVGWTSALTGIWAIGAIVVTAYPQVEDDEVDWRSYSTRSAQAQVRLIIASKVFDKYQLAENEHSPEIAGLHRKDRAEDESAGKQVRNLIEELKGHIKRNGFRPQMLRPLYQYVIDLEKEYILYLLHRNDPATGHWTRVLRDDQEAMVKALPRQTATEPHTFANRFARHA